ncbi:MAG: Gfo/Idh/MocA family oxidoreductase [Fimbriimonadales bacterium]|nr:Gfo/Idh/MocA family oxidoreductase [Fimbriimonadales bacterium]
MATVRVGVAGKRGGAFLPALRAQPGVSVVALCELNEQWLDETSRGYGIERTTRSYDELLELCDAVIVATPMHLHAEQSILALQAGKHVLSEVTACVSLEECWRLWAAARQSEATYAFAENYCFIPDVVLVGEMARRGLFGEPYYAEGEYLHEVRSLHHAPDGALTWRALWQVGTTGLTYPTHSLGPAVQWFRTADPCDRPASVAAMGSGAHTDPEHPHDDTSVALVRMASGRLIRLRLDMMSNRPHLMAYYALQGTRGAYEASRLEGQPGWVWVGNGVTDEPRQWRPLSDFADLMPQSYRDARQEALRAGHGGGDWFLVEDWVRTLLGEQPPTIGIEDALEWTAVGLLSTLSVQSGGVPLRVPDFRQGSDRPAWA